MLSQDLRNLIINTYGEVDCYRKTAVLCKVSPNTVRNLVLGLHKEDKKRPGPKPIINSRMKRQIKRKAEVLIGEGQKVTARKLIAECSIANVSARTMRRTLRQMSFNYKEAVKKIVLTPEHRKKRLEFARHWLPQVHLLMKCAWSDEKRFNLDGPDSWCS